MALPRRALFRRGKSYVCVKHIRLSRVDVIEPGAPIQDGLPEWRLKSWYRRGLIGVVDDAWTNWVLDGLEKRGELYEAKVAKKAAEAASYREDEEPSTEGSDGSPVSSPEAPMTEPASEEPVASAAPKETKPSTRKAPAKGKSTKPKK